MSTSVHRESKGLEAVSIAFSRSLKSLEIEPVRFRALPFRQRKLAMCEAIYKTAKHVSGELSWHEDRSDLHARKLWDFTIDQIVQHQTVVDALIALVCLGESSFVRPLVSYLSFPEQRWSILIDSVLKAVAIEPTRGPIFRIPNDRELHAWRKWAIDTSEPPALRDYSDILLSNIGIEEIRERSFQAYLSKSTESSSLINRNEFFQADWEYFDQKQASFSSSNLFPLLKSYEFERFALFLEDFVRENPSEGNFNTLVACTNDWISELRLTKSKLRQNWLALLSERDVSSRTGAVLFQILVYPQKDRALARTFGKKLLRGERDLYVLAVISDIITQSQSPVAINRMARAYSAIDDLSDQLQSTLNELSPMASTTLRLWIKNLVSREIENVCIVGGEKESKQRVALIESMNRVLRSHDHAIWKLRVLSESPNSQCREFGRQIKLFFEMRREIFGDFMEEDRNTSRLVSRYVKLFYDCLHIFKNLKISKWLKA